MPARSNNAADAAGLERLRLCIAGPKQSPTSRRETTEAVANQESQVVEKQQRDVAPSACAGRLRIILARQPFRRVRRDPQCVANQESHARSKQ